MIGSRVKDVLQTVSQAKANLARALVITFAVSLILSFILAYYQTGRIKKLSLAARKVLTVTWTSRLTTAMPMKSTTWPKTSMKWSGL